MAAIQKVRMKMGYILPPPSGLFRQDCDLRPRLRAGWLDLKRLDNWGSVSSCLAGFSLRTWQHPWQSVQLGGFLPSRVGLSEVVRVLCVALTAFVIPWGLVFCAPPVPYYLIAHL